MKDKKQNLQVKHIVEMQKVIKYTFIFEYEGGTYVKQVSAPDLKLAMYTWASLVGFDIPGFNYRRKKQLISGIESEEPTLLMGLENVWHSFFLLGRSSGFLNIIATL
jgi:hypothetical protein